MIKKTEKKSQISMFFSLKDTLDQKHPLFILEEKIKLKESIRINGDDRFDPDVSIDTTVQEKNITYPTDNKLHRKIITKCKVISEKEELPIMQSYSRTLKNLAIEQRFRNHPNNHSKARKADRKLKTD